jgi:hypothetical protein
MKDAEFIELLNLYLDHEISAADAARLEAEVQRNPERHRIYRQYCQMQKACSMLSADFVAEQEQQKVIAFEPRRSSWQPALWGTAGLAAAACVAFVMFNRTTEVAPAMQPIAAATYVAPAVEPQALPPGAQSEARAIARTVTTPSRRMELQPVLTGSSLSLGNSNAQNVALAPAELDWIRNVRLAPMQVAPTAEDLRFDVRPTLRPEPAVFRSSRPMQGQVEMSAFQFQK